MEEWEKTSYKRSEHEYPKPEFVNLFVGPGQYKDNRAFGELLSRIREDAGRTRAEVAAELDLSAEYLRLIELGRRTPALGQMSRFIKAYRARGDVRKLQPGGDRPDLMIRDVHNEEPIVVEFMSRIREARQSASRSSREAPGLRKRADFFDLESDEVAEDYASDFGLTILLLSRASHKTIVKVRDLLRSEME